MIEFRQWGTDIDEGSIEQMREACALPISRKAALMPDAHLGYGLPIGGVLATENAVIPYAVGVDIACRVMMTVFPEGPHDLHSDKLAAAIEKETRFGMGAHFDDDARRDHDVMDDDWSVSHITKDNKDRAWSQLGSSGGGNHFVEFGVFNPDGSGTRLALLTHSGSRGVGHQVCQHYYKLAKEKHPYLSNSARNLAWLDMDSEEGQEYWAAMELMGRYASANHSCIHKTIAANLGLEPMISYENHHNFAWKETHDGEELIVHRKGATPAGKGVYGVIPGSMADLTFLVKGKGGEGSLRSAAHGAGRHMGRKQAKRTLDADKEFAKVRAEGVRVLSAGLDEVPAAYKSIYSVMEAQSDLVEVVGSFMPMVVKMAGDGYVED